MTIAQRHEAAESFSTREETIDYSTAYAVSRVLKREVSPIDFENLWYDWNAFTKEPEKYANSIVVDMVNQYLDERG